MPPIPSHPIPHPPVGDIGVVPVLQEGVTDGAGGAQPQLLCPLPALQAGDPCGIPGAQRGRGEPGATGRTRGNRGRSPVQGPYSQERSNRRNISRSAGSGAGCEGEREPSRTFTCTLSWSLSFLSLSLPGGRPAPRRRSRRGKESVMRRGCSMALRDTELARPRRYREQGGTRRYREPAGRTRPCPWPGGSGGAGLGNRPRAPPAAATLAVVPVPRTPPGRAPLSPGVVTPRLSPSPAALSPPRQFLSPEGTVTSIPVFPVPLALSPVSVTVTPCTATPQLYQPPSVIVAHVTVPITSGTVTSVVLPAALDIVTPIPALPMALDTVTPPPVPISPPNHDSRFDTVPSHSALCVTVCPSSAFRSHPQLW